MKLNNLGVYIVHTFTYNQPKNQKTKNCKGHKIVSLFYTAFVQYIFHFDKFQVILEIPAEKHAGLHVRCLLLSQNLSKNWKCVDTFFEMSPVPDLIQLKLLHADGHMDRKS